MDQCTPKYVTALKFCNSTDSNIGRLRILWTWKTGKGEWGELWGGVNYKKAS